MSAPIGIRRLVGEWSGSNILSLSPTEPPDESETAATVGFVAGERFAILKYTWTYGDAPQDGLILLSTVDELGTVEAAWIDSFHMGDKLMNCEGRLAGDTVSIKGAYAAPPGPDWGWRIVIQTSSDDTFELLMFNIPPGGDEVLAVKATYTRRQG